MIILLVPNLVEKLMQPVLILDWGLDLLQILQFSVSLLCRYGAILDNWRGRKDLLDKIKGCVVDSGADPHIDPKVCS